MSMIARNLGDYIAHVDAAIKRFSISTPARILNCNRTGIKHTNTFQQTLQKGLGRSQQPCYQVQVATSGGLSLINLISVVRAFAKAANQAIIFLRQKS